MYNKVIELVKARKNGICFGKLCDELGLKPTQAFPIIQKCCLKGTIEHEEMPNGDNWFFPSSSTPEPETPELEIPKPKTPEPVIKVKPKYAYQTPMVEEKVETPQSILQNIIKNQTHSMIGWDILNRYDREMVKSLQLQGKVIVKDEKFVKAI